ncbi:hypothetical protein CGLAUT_08135 [Corynebacterium glaucum]|nr:hypothetical protein [Corynebacterium glaucum]WJZ08108.1 hypothetical protein CGLAUT_08135 [Corynebacterium glaucum]
MTMQPRPNNPIERRKQEMRKHMNAALAWGGGGVAGGVALGLIFSSWPLFILGFVVAVVGGFVNYNKAQKIVNHVDEY